ncbi:MAG: hypothetical protein QOG53_651 [Frankiales bacterium]|jgi:hypothetical protein|nr:hypothetical protein [Frankiales bacterium]
MTDEDTPAKTHLREALERLAELCEPLSGMQLKDWYVITTHTDDAGEEIMSRFTRTGQMPWIDAGLLTFALQQDEREWAEDEEDDEDATYT